METIKSYLENVFSALPKTTELLDIKYELENNMLDKYHELKQEGKSENEAIGIVISEFGNIDELLEEMNISVTAPTNTFRTISLEDTQTYIKLKKKSSLYISLGVALILFSVANLIGMSAFIDHGLLFTNLPGDTKDLIPIILLLICVAISVAIFIIADAKLGDLKCIDEDEFNLSESTIAILKKDFSNLNSSTSVIFGVTLCILSPVAIFIGSIFGDIGSSLGVSALLLIIALAVFIFINGGIEKDAYDKLLHRGDYNPSKKDNPVIRAVSSIVWSLAVCIFLGTGLVWHLWYINWVIFPITGVLFAGFCTCYNALQHK